MTDKQLYKYICVKYPDINYTEGEDLSLDGIYAKELARMWPDKNNYPNIVDMMTELDISERTLYRLSKKYNMGKRPLKYTTYESA